MPGILVLDDADRVVHSNERAFDMLRDIGEGEPGEEQPAPALPRVLATLVPQLRARLRDRADTSTAALLTVDLCVRACNMRSDNGKSLLLVLERVHRRDAVRHNLEKFALSPRECDVVMLVLYGHSNRRIAAQLFLTEYTIEDHLKRVFAKLAVRSRTALAAKILGWREVE
ncbi:MAG TPA: helix-turn-helix transcriptional regulator [Candidatus Eremiobacteraceae bacterium]|nr:helix-turn-helix transcriptional regulator [Candidatus Eremiobacteraceae bacterium]